MKFHVGQRVRLARLLGSEALSAAVNHQTSPLVTGRYWRRVVRQFRIGVNPPHRGPRVAAG